MALPPKKSGITIAVGVGKPKEDDLGAPSAPGHEDTETPEYEESEESGADLLGAITKPLTEAGLSDDEAKSMLCDIFEAVCKSLKGGKESAEPAAEEAAEPEQNPYGR